MVWFGAGRNRAFMVHLVALASDASGPVCDFYSGGGLHCALLWLRTCCALYVQFGIGPRLLHVSPESGHRDLRERTATGGDFCSHLGAGCGVGSPTLAR